MWESTGNRSSMEIVADILRLLRLGNTSNIEIAHVSRMNGIQADIYLEKLVKVGVLINAKDRMDLPSYQITKKGLTFLSMIENLQELIPGENSLGMLRNSKITEINIGRILVTKGVHELANENKRFAAFVEKSLARYRSGDWGEMSTQDKHMNDFSEQNARLLLSSYESPNLPEVWIMTSPSREFTTLMFPEQYTSLEPLEPYSARSDLKFAE